MPSELTLRRPREDEEEEFLRAHRATSPEAPSFLHYYTEGMPFRRYLEVLAEHEQGINLPSAHVPSTFLFAFVGARIVGRTSIRHSLNDSLERVGGHIGYVVSGGLEIDFRGKVVSYPAGSGIFIPPGSAGAHKARSVTPVVRLVLVEDA